MLLLFRLQFTLSSAGWLLLSLLIGAGYAYFLYHRGASRFLSNQTRTLLFFVRALCVAFISFLLFAPLVRIIDRAVEKPVIVIAQDNSASIRLWQPKGFNLSAYSNQISALRKRLAEQYEVEVLSFGDSVQPRAPFSYDEGHSDLRGLFSALKQEYRGRNLRAVVFASDGIFTRGGSPQREALALNVPVYTIALGDTIPRKDLLINDLNYNSVVPEGSRISLTVEVLGRQASGLSSRLTVKEGSKVLSSTPVLVDSHDYYSAFSLTLPSLRAGTHFFEVEVAPVEDELTGKNNSREFHIEVIDRKKRIMLLADSPHPDVSALKQSLESHSNFEVKTFVAEQLAGADLSGADLAILHQLPSKTFPLRHMAGALSRLPRFYVLGARTDLQTFSEQQNVLKAAPGGEGTEVRVTLNKDFQSFSIDSAEHVQLNELGPLWLPAQNYHVGSNALVLLRQETVGQQPLWLFSSDGPRKQGLLAGEGFWKWRLNEFRLKGSHRFTDELLEKSVLYLTTDTDRKRLRVFPAKQIFDEGDAITLYAELYNEVYELINEPDVSITLRRQGGSSYPFLFSREANRYRLDAGILPPGKYTFEASGKQGDSVLTDAGGILISEWNAEYRQTEPDHQLLSLIARSTGGELLMPAQLNNIDKLLGQNEEVTSLVFEDRRYEDLIYQKWLFVFLLIFLSGEWLLRKRSGGW